MPSKTLCIGILHRRQCDGDGGDDDGSHGDDEEWTHSRNVEKSFASERKGGVHEHREESQSEAPSSELHGKVLIQLGSQGSILGGKSWGGDIGNSISKHHNTCPC